MYGDSNLMDVPDSDSFSRLCLLSGASFTDHN